MSAIKWLELLGWGEQELGDLRFVGYSYVKQGKYDIAQKIFEALAILSPKSAYDLQTLGAIYLQKGNNLSALDYLERSLRLDPLHGATLINRAKALFLLGYKRQALDQARQLENFQDPTIRDQASVLILTHI